MARAQLNNAVGELKTIVKEMRALGVASWLNSPIGDIHLGPEPRKEPKLGDADPKAPRRTYYSELYGRPVTDAELEKLP